MRVNTEKNAENYGIAPEIAQCTVGAKKYANDQNS
jgi:hypothetical protein